MSTVSGTGTDFTCSYVKVTTVLHKNKKRTISKCKVLLISAITNSSSRGKTINKTFFFHELVRHVKDFTLNKTTNCTFFHTLERYNQDIPV